MARNAQPDASAPQAPPNQSEPSEPPLSRVPDWLLRFGTSAWMTLGLIGLAVVVYLGLRELSALVAPLVVAVVIGMLFYPVVDALAARGLNRGLGASVVLLGIVAAASIAVFMAVRGVIDQGPEIVASLEEGWVTLQQQLTDFNIDLQAARDLVSQLGSGDGLGLGGLLSTTFSSVASLLIGLFIGTFLLFFLLRDWHPISAFLGRNAGLPQDLGSGLINDATTSIRRYFYGLTISSIIVSILIGLAMALLGLPLAFTIALVTFVTSYIPYLGAIFAGAFACLVALGSGGVGRALIVLAVVIFTQNVVQTVVQTKITSDQLQLHPIVNLGSTVVGAAFAGIIGATLSAPAVAMVIAARKRLIGYNWSDSRTHGDPAAQPAPAPPPGNSAN